MTSILFMDTLTIALLNFKNKVQNMKKLRRYKMKKVKSLVVIVICLLSLSIGLVFGTQEGEHKGRGKTLIKAV